jgi:phospholipid/cholesterol/gamma-HCH transport system substrate-binding protein
MKRAVLAALAATSALALTGCSSYQGLNSLPLPGDVGTGSGSYQVTVKLDSADNLVANVPVLVGDVNVGTVTKVALDDWTPTLTLRLGRDVRLPANVEATLGQTSVLGSKHIELAPPADRPAEGTLLDGAVVPESRTHRYPETEDVLAGVSLLLNGGGLQNAQTITTELNHLFGGREQQVRDFLTQINTFTTGLDAQKGDIISALQGMDRLGRTLAPQTQTIATALQTLPQGLATLRAEEPAITTALHSLGRSGQSIQPLADEGSDQLRGVFHELEPALRHTADAGQPDVMKALNYVPFGVFPLPYVPTTFRGDAINASLTFDFTNENIDKNFLGGTPLAGVLGNIDRVLRGQGPGKRTASPLLPSMGSPAANPPLPAPALPGLGDPTPPPALGGTTPAPGLGRKAPSTGDRPAGGLVAPLTSKLGG